MPGYCVEVVITFRVEARAQEQAQERAQLLADSITAGFGAVSMDAWWLGSVSVGKPTVNEA